MKKVPHLAAIALLLLAVACGSDSTTTETVTLSPAGPSGSTGGTGGTGGTVTLTAPTPDSPADGLQTNTLRPTLTVINGTSSAPSAGIRTYEFQVSDNSNFTVGGGMFSLYYAVVVNKTGVPEDASGKTSYTPDADLQPATVFYWRARVLQGSVTSSWSTGRTFKTRIAGYNRAGELYDPLVGGDTVGTPVGSTTFVAGKGIKLNTENSWVKYTLVQTITSGEFSADVDTLGPNAPTSKGKIFSMMDGGDNLYNSNYLANVQYRGVSGNPDNCISWKAVIGTQSIKLEPDATKRAASVMSLISSKTYLWKATWGSEFRLQIFDGGSADTGVGGSMIYDYGQSQAGGTYAPSPHTAYLGANNGPFGQESGTYPGAVYRNVWIGNRARPTSLGSALR